MNTTHQIEETCGDDCTASLSYHEVSIINFRSSTCFCPQILDGICEYIMGFREGYPATSTCLKFLCSDTKVRWWSVSIETQVICFHTFVYTRRREVSLQAGETAIIRSKRRNNIVVVFVCWCIASIATDGTCCRQIHRTNLFSVYTLTPSTDR